MGYIIAIYFTVFFILRKFVNGLRRVVEKGGRLYELKSADGKNYVGKCTFGKNKYCGIEPGRECRCCYLKSEISRKKFIFGRVVIVCYSVTVLTGGLFFISMMSGC